MVNKENALDDLHHIRGKQCTISMFYNFVLDSTSMQCTQVIDFSFLCVQFCGVTSDLHDKYMVCNLSK